jgi:hypothetical protein
MSSSLVGASRRLAGSQIQLRSEKSNGIVGRSAPEPEDISLSEVWNGITKNGKMT